MVFTLYKDSRDNNVYFTIVVVSRAPAPARTHTSHMNDTQIRKNIYDVCGVSRLALRSARQPLAEIKFKSAICPSRERGGPLAAPPVRRARRPRPRRRRWLRWLRCSSSLTSEAGWRRRAGREGAREETRGERVVGVWVCGGGGGVTVRRVEGRGACARLLVAGSALR